MLPSDKSNSSCLEFYKICIECALAFQRNVVTSQADDVKAAE